MDGLPGPRPAAPAGSVHFVKSGGRSRCWRAWRSGERRRDAVAARLKGQGRRGRQRPVQRAAGQEGIQEGGGLVAGMPGAIVDLVRRTAAHCRWAGLPTIDETTAAVNARERRRAGSREREQVVPRGGAPHGAACLVATACPRDTAHCRDPAVSYGNGGPGQARAGWRRDARGRAAGGGARQEAPRAIAIRAARWSIRHRPRESPCRYKRSVGGRRPRGARQYLKSVDQFWQQNCRLGILALAAVVAARPGDVV